MSRYLTASMFVVANIALAFVNHSAHAAGPVLVKPTIPVVRPTVPAVKAALPAVKPTVQAVVRPAWMPAPPKNESSSPRETMYTYADGSTSHGFIRNDGKWGVTLHDPKTGKIEDFTIDPKTGFMTPGTAPSGK